MPKRIVFLLFLLVLLSNCATIIKGGKQEVSFTSVPEDTIVIVNGRTLGKTPVTTTIDRKSDQILTFEKEGYKTLTLPFTTTINGWFWGNIAIGGLIGSTTDGLSGAVYEYSPSQYNITLVPTDKTFTENTETIKKNEIKSYIISGYNNILMELDTKSGEYVNSLTELLKVKKENRNEAIEKIKQLSTIYRNIPEFADQVVNYFIK